MKPYFGNRLSFVEPIGFVIRLPRKLYSWRILIVDFLHEFGSSFFSRRCIRYIYANETKFNQFFYKNKNNLFHIILFLTGYIIISNIGKLIVNVWNKNYGS